MKYRDNIIRKRWQYKIKTKEELSKIKEKINDEKYLDNAIEHLAYKLAGRIMK